MSVGTEISQLRKILERNSPFSPPRSDEEDVLNYIRTQAKVLVIGCGGLGCELIKNLALMGFVHIHVIDMDTIELSNLNRQFLFREKDIGQSKAEVAARLINTKVPGVQVEPHFCRIEDKDSDFYRQFSIIVSGLDSVQARRWINSMVVSLLEYNDGELGMHSHIACPSRLFSDQPPQIYFQIKDLSFP